MPTHYEVLGVAPDASADAIRRAFRQAAKRLHPDRETGAAAAMVRLNEAYETLKDPDRRAAYDRRHGAGTRLPARPPARPAGRPAGGVPTGLDPLEFRLRVLAPVDAAVAPLFPALLEALEALSYDVYDDTYVARFAAAVAAAAGTLATAQRQLLGTPWPEAIASGLNRYRQALQQAGDALEDFAGFELSYDTDALVEGRGLLREAARMRVEARGALGL